MEIHHWQEDSPVHGLQTNAGVAPPLRFSPDGRFLAAGAAGNTVTVWETATFQRWASPRGHTERVLDLDWAPDSRSLASASQDRTIVLWQLDAEEVTEDLSTWL
ncbi:hypothetical protein M8C13_19285 [Crossiella sp. SN42]|uniref:WD40 repeat domain-containing protein n=1 Tax=Crossiella sp. SN42 TaxID=2944808 RepID=UPI00207CC4AF|nr:hypothetical protein [Crossiella sp. SN42]MCO1577901.1 hypothetical protein [Crossiella sp. SN42]